MLQLHSILAVFKFQHIIKCSLFVAYDFSTEYFECEYVIVTHHDLWSSFLLDITPQNTKFVCFIVNNTDLIFAEHLRQATFNKIAPNV